jgi:ribosomal 50S subunit-recycling heat shock protein
VRLYDDLVEVRKGADEDPDQFLWRGRLWQVREVVAHWVETGAWWARRPAAPAADQTRGSGEVDTDLLREREVWRVAAARGRVAAAQSAAAQSLEHDPGFGVFDLVFSWSEGSWQLVRAMD